MTRETPTARPSLAARCAVIGLVASACGTQTVFSGSLDTPSPIAILQSATSPFDTPVGYVADTNGGRIRLLDLQRGRYLVDDPVASFLRAASIGTGDERLLDALAAWAPDRDHAFVFATDLRFEQLLRIAHVDGRDERGFPHEPVATVVGVPAFADVDGSGDSASLEAITFDDDVATSETWTFTFDGTAWQTDGSRSGPQPPAFFDVAWHTRNASMTLILRGTATAGDTLTLVVDRAVEEFALDGPPIDLTISPDGTRLALTHGLDDGTGALQFADPADVVLGAPIVLDAGARPTELAWTSDGATLFAADGALPVVWEVDPATGAALRHDVPWPVAHLAVTTGTAGRHAYLAQVGGGEVWLLDLDTDTFLDLDPSTAAIDGMRLLGTIQGLAPVDLPYDLPADVDLLPDVTSVAISLFDGTVVFMRESDGCLVPDALGPRTLIKSSTNVFGDYDPQYPIAIPGTAYLQAIESTDATATRHVTVNPCAGLAPSESWELRYDEILQGWRVRGTVSGVQEGSVFEDQRYVSDRGQLSLVMRAGATPSQDGWLVLFDVLDGALRANGDRDGDGLCTGTNEHCLDLPGRPAVFTRMIAGVAVPGVVIAARTADFIVRIDPRTGLVDASWQ